MPWRLVFSAVVADAAPVFHVFHAFAKNRVWAHVKPSKSSHFSRSGPFYTRASQKSILWAAQKLDLKRKNARLSNIDTSLWDRMADSTATMAITVMILLHE